MAKPVKPVAPPRALRSQPETFADNADAWITYQWGVFPDYIDASSTFVDQRSDDALAAAVAAAAGNLSEAQREAFAGAVVGIQNAPGYPLEGVLIEEYDVSPFIETLLDDADATAARATLGVPYASQAQAQGGTATGVVMTPLRTAQAVAAQVPAAQTPPTTAQVLAATAGASVGAVGSYALLTGGGGGGSGGTIAGSSLAYSNAAGGGGGSGSPAGTWRRMGESASSTFETQATLYLRIS